MPQRSPPWLYSLIGSTVSVHEDVNPTAESAAVCLKRVALAVCRAHRGLPVGFLLLRYSV